MQLVLFDEQAEAQHDLDQRLAPILGPLIPITWDTAGGQKTGDLVRHVRCPKCRVVAWNEYRLDNCLCPTWKPPHSQAGPGLNWYRAGADGTYCFGPVWTERDGWLYRPEPKLTGRVWEFGAIWNKFLARWVSRHILAEVSDA